MDTQVFARPRWGTLLVLGRRGRCIDDNQEPSIWQSVRSRLIFSEIKTKEAAFSQCSRKPKQEDEANQIVFDIFMWTVYMQYQRGKLIFPPVPECH